MAHIEVVNKPYSNPDDVKHVVNYICRNFSPAVAIYGSKNVILLSLDSVVNQFMVVENIFNKYIGRQLRHFIVSFLNDEFVSVNKAMKIAYLIDNYYGSRYQIIHSIHTDTNNLHIHFVLNSVSYVDGKMFSEGVGEFIVHISVTSGH